MSTGDRAHYQQLNDAISSAFQALSKIRGEEQIRDVMFGQFEDGGWWFEIKLASYRTIGNSKEARIASGVAKDFNADNARMIVDAAQGAFLREAAIGNELATRRPTGRP